MAAERKDYVDLSNMQKKDVNKTGKSKKRTVKKEKIKDASVPKNIIKKPKPHKTNTRVKMHVETNVDRLYEIVKNKGMIKISEVAKKLKVEKEQVEEWGRVLEDHKLVKLHYPPIGDPVIILKNFKPDVKVAGKEKGKKKEMKIKPGRKVFIINLVILLVFFGIVASFTIRLPSVRISYSQVYLAVIALIIIIVAILVLKFRKRLVPLIGKVRKREEEKTGKKS